MIRHTVEPNFQSPTSQINSLIKLRGLTPGVLAAITGFGNLFLGADYKYSEIAAWIEPLGVFGKKSFLAPT